MPAGPSRDVQILHLSDIHFGKKHRFEPDVTPGGDRAVDPDFPDLFDKLKSEFGALLEREGPTLLCITGDITESASPAEFALAEKFLERVRATFGKLGNSNIYLVPGNHDVIFTEDDMAKRWTPWTQFYDSVFAPVPPMDPADPASGTRLDLRWNDGLAVLCLNSSIFVRKDTPEEDRGHLGDKQLARVRGLLKAARADSRWPSLIKIALVHHHPIVIPSMAEAFRGYDAIVDGGDLLATLRRFGFHLILHGHKHLPTTFTEDTRLASHTSDHVMVVCAGGSVGSRSLPAASLVNTFNRILVKWQPDVEHARIFIETRELMTQEDTDHLPAHDWTWKTLRVDDRVLTSFVEMPKAQHARGRAFDPAQDAAADRERTRLYQQTRGFMATAILLPSLRPGQEYEARLWIVEHVSHRVAQRSPKPLRATWLGGQNFPVMTVEAFEDPQLAICVEYYGPMLFQARLEFPDGAVEDTYVYVRLPNLDQTSGRP